MSIAVLEDYFDKWLALTAQQREFISVLIMGQFATVPQILALLEKWYSEKVVG